MFKFRWVLVVLLVACASGPRIYFPRSHVPEGVSPLPDPPAQWAVWWEETEECTGFKYPFEYIQWFSVEAGWGTKGESYECPWTKDGICYAQIAYLDDSRGVIYVSEGRFEARSTITHEAVHVLKKVGNASHLTDLDFCYCTFTNPENFTQEQKDQICTGR